MNKLFFIAALVLVLAPSWCFAQVKVEFVVSEFNEPLDFQVAQGLPNRFFIAERGGKIIGVSEGQMESTPFLDITSLVTSESQGQGLLGFTFHPHFDSNRFLYVSYVDLNGDTVIARYTSDTDGVHAIEDSTKIILTIPQPFAKHNSGQLAFGPDGYLYISVADGGSDGDSLNNGQNLETLLGKILRIDVDNGDPYSSPPTNPFLSDINANDEIWMHGFRNPWRFSFDSLAGDLYISDVGQNKLEEINIVAATSTGGENFGWNLMEGSECFDPDRDCDTTNLVSPSFEYQHKNGFCSVIGGYVYRGDSIPSIQGHYFFGDFCKGAVLSLKWSDGIIVETRDWTDSLDADLSFMSSFGQDHEGEIYIVLLSGDIYKLVPDSE